MLSWDIYTVNVNAAHHASATACLSVNLNAGHTCISIHSKTKWLLPRFCFSRNMTLHLYDTRLPCLFSNVRFPH